MDAEVIVIGAGIGGLVTAAQLAAGGIDVLVLEKYLIPGGSAGYFDREVPEGHYRFDVGASMIYGFGTEGTTNLLTRALAAVDEHLETIPDPVQISYHLPKGLNPRVHRDYKRFIEELSRYFPEEKEGIRAFYDEAWRVFNCLNAIELKSLEEIRYLTRVFFQNPLACLGLARYLPVNVGSVARKYLKSPDLLKFIDMECYCWSVVTADQTPMINAGMVWADRHYGGINYPQGGVGRIGEALTRGITKKGGRVRYGARVTQVLVERGRAVGVRLATGEVLKAKKIISNATRWDTFGQMIPEANIPATEIRWRKRYEPSPSFLSLHLGVKREVLAQEVDMHHVVLEDWQRLTEEQGTIFVSIPTILDPTIAPPGRHIIHTFAPSSIEHWQGLNPTDYAQKKAQDAQCLIERLSKIWPGLAEAITFMEVGTPRTHRRFLGRMGGTYGPIPSGIPLGLLGTPFNRTAIKGLYCVGDSTFPGQGLNAVAFSGIACAHRVAVDLGITSGIPIRT
jgi:prolycopene isomerase